MQQTVTIECPPEILLGLHLNAEGFADFLKKQAAINLFKEGKLSSGTVAAWLGIGRLAFLRLAFEAGATLLEDTPTILRVKLHYYDCAPNHALFSSNNLCSPTKPALFPFDMSLNFQ